MLDNMADRTSNKNKNHTTKRSFPCTFNGCSSVFKKRSHLIRHELVHSDERPFTCNFENCGKAFRSPFHLKRHEATHSGDKKYRCDYEGCDVACVTEWNLKRHIKRTHCGTFKCKTCNKEFKKNKLLQQHESLEHQTSTICCEFPGCGLVFSVPAKMRHHLKVHTGKGYTCPVKGCSARFQLWSECRLHAAQCKIKEKSCDVCGKTFTERSNLKEHLKIHSEEREVFQCTYDGCGRFYTKQSNLKVHVQSYHQNIRPFVCPKTYCKKSFHFQHLLRNHLECHARNDIKQENCEGTIPVLSSVVTIGNESDKTLGVSHEVKEPKRKKRSKRMVTSTISAISGYIPELWKKLTPAEMKEYVTDAGCYADTDIIPREDDTTQLEMTPIHSGDLDQSGSITANSHEVSQQGEADEAASDLDETTATVVTASEETLTAQTDVEVSEDEGQIIFHPLKSLQEACSYLDRVNKLSFVTPSSSSSSRAASAGEDGEQSLKMGAPVKGVAGNERKRAFVHTSSSVYDSCHMQSVTESDSSDSEVKKKVRILLSQCAS